MRILVTALTLASVVACSPVDCGLLLTCGPFDPGAGASGSGGSKLDGQTCGAASECLSTFCTDGVCCASACDAVCESCNAQGSEGTCAPHAIGTDPETECAPGSCGPDAACATGEHVWSFGLGPGGDVSGTSVAVDASGNVLIAGMIFDGSIDFGDGPLLSNGPIGFVVKYSPSGEFMWKRLLTGANGIDSLQVQVRADGADNVYVSGWFETATLTIGSSTHTNVSGSDLFLAKFDATGSPLWSKRFGLSGGYQQSRVFDVNESGRVLIAGPFSGSLNLGGGTLTSSPYLFAASYDGDGNHLWSKAVGAPSSSLDSQVGGSGGIDREGNAYLTGYFRVRASFGGPFLDDPVETPAVGPLFLAKLVAANGNHGWSHAYGDDAIESPFFVEVHLDTEASAFCVAGRFLEDFDLGGGPLALSRGSAFFAGFDANATHLWSRSVETFVAGIGAHEHGCTAVGNFTGAPDFGGGPLSTTGGTDIFAVKYAPTGEHLWSRKFGDAQNQPEFVHVAVAADGSVVLFGTNFDISTVDFGGGPISDHFYVAKLAP